MTIQDRLRKLLLHLLQAATVHLKAWSWHFGKTVLGISVLVLVTLALGTMRGCRRADSPKSQDVTVVAPTPADRHGTPGTKRVVAFKPVPNDTRYDAFLQADDALREDVERFVEALLQEQSAPAAVQVRTLFRLHTTGHFLRQLNDWAGSTSAQFALSDSQQLELASLLDRWSDLRGQIIALSKNASDTTPTQRNEIR